MNWNISAGASKSLQAKIMSLKAMCETPVYNSPINVAYAGIFNFNKKD